MTIHLTSAPERSKLTASDRVALKRAVQAALSGFKDLIDHTCNPRIYAIMTSTGCSHGCSFCGVSYSGPADPINPELVAEAKSRCMLRVTTNQFDRGVLLTGGEPLDHPAIVELVRLASAEIPVTNGFSGTTHQPESWPGLCTQLNHSVESITFSITDRWHGQSPGRNAVITQAILAARTLPIGFIFELGNELETLKGWLGTALQIASDPAVQSASQSNLDVSHAVLHLPFIAFLEKQGFRPPLMVGRGERLSGLHPSILSLGRALTKEPLSTGLNGTILFPNGTLHSWFLACNLFDAGPAVGNLGDPPETIRRNLQAAISQSLSNRFSDPEQEVDAYLENVRVEQAACINLCNALGHPEVRGLGYAVKDEVSKLGILAIMRPAKGYLCDWNSETFERLGLQSAAAAAAGNLRYVNNLLRF